MIKQFTSALKGLKPSFVVDKLTGEALTDQEWRQPVEHLLNFCQSETQRLFDVHQEKLLIDLPHYKNNATGFAQQRGYVSGCMDLPRDIRGKSRVNRLILHKLISETASYVNSPNAHKQPPTFPKSMNLGAVDTQMVQLALDGMELTLLWKCWDRELIFVFQLPDYIRGRNIRKVSLPTVRMNKDNEVVFQFSIQETSTLRTNSEHSAGVDLGRVEPYVLAVTNAQGKRVAHYTASPRLRSLATKQERLQAENSHLFRKIRAYKDLGIDSSILETHKSHVKAASTRLTKELALQMGAEITNKLKKHSISILNLENLKWVSGRKGSQIGMSRWAHSQQQEAISHAVMREGILTKTVSPKNTSQLCAACGSVITHKQRNVRCFDCQTTLNRDVNASLNIANDINKNKRFPITRRDNGDNCRSNEQVMVRHEPDSVSENELLTRILT